MSANKRGGEIKLDDLGFANLHWSEQFLLVLGKQLKNAGIDSKKTISEGLRKTITVPFVFDYPAKEKFVHEKMQPHARKCVNKAWCEAGMPLEMHARNAYLIHLVDQTRCVVFALFEYEYALSHKNNRPLVEDILEGLIPPHAPHPARNLEKEVSLSYPVGRPMLDVGGIECIIPAEQKQKRMGGRPQQNGKRKKRRGKGKRK